MEHEPGSNCEVSGCFQRDFLPFKCDLCHKIVCLAHKTYAAHSCEAALSKDMTSLDCPVCRMAIKFSKAEDPDAVWHRHYAVSGGCKPPKSIVAPKKCPCCITTLGPSNTWKCPKCALEVCLTHRLPEDHQCKAINGNNRIPPIPSNQQAPTTNPPKYTVKRNIQPPSQYVGENSLRGSAERRMAHAAAASTGNRSGTSNDTVHTCPRCGERFADAVLLVSHFEISHPDGNGTSSSGSSSSGGSSSGLSAAADLFSSSAIAAQNAALSAFNSATRFGQSDSNQSSSPPSTTTPTSASSRTATATTQYANDGLGREVCPICSRRFVDAADLVVHYQTAHDTTPSSSTNNINNSNSSPQIFSGQDCSIS